jgi:hypothetical protein
MELRSNTLAEEPYDLPHAIVTLMSPSGFSPTSAAHSSLPRTMPGIADPG